MFLKTLRRRTSSFLAGGFYRGLAHAGRLHPRGAWARGKLTSYPRINLETVDLSGSPRVSMAPLLAIAALVLLVVGLGWWLLWPGGQGEAGRHPGEAPAAAIPVVVGQDAGASSPWIPNRHGQGRI